MRLRESRWPMFTTHSRKIDASTERRDQDCTADLGIAQNQLFDRLARNFRDNAAGQHLHVVVGFLEEQVLEIQRVAGDADGEDLARTVAGQLVADA